MQSATSIDKTYDSQKEGGNQINFLFVHGIAMAESNIQTFACLLGMCNLHETPWPHKYAP